MDKETQAPVREFSAEPEENLQEPMQTCEEPPKITTQPQRVCVADIHFRNNDKTYYFDPNGLNLEPGDHVIMETARGNEYGICCGGNHTVRAAEVVAPLRKVLRLATANDEKINKENQEREKRAFVVGQKKIAEHGLEMQLVSCECSFDGSKLLFFFTSDDRVDFRNLVKDLASVFRTRIELRQIGVRDKARMVGGLGICGRPFCCREFLPDFQPVSIKMAKTQNLSLNPLKISGTCGRLMCCLKYEQEAYEDLLRTTPKEESFVDTPDGRGTVTDVNLMKQTVKVRMENDPSTVTCYHNCDICVLRNGKAHKNDPPIPDNLAPISSKPQRKKRWTEDDPDTMPDLVFNDDVAAISPESFTKPTPVEPKQAITEPAAVPNVVIHPSAEQKNKNETVKQQPRRRNNYGRRKENDAAGFNQAPKGAAPHPDEKKQLHKQAPKAANPAPAAEKPNPEGQTSESKPKRNNYYHRRYRGHRPSGNKPEASKGE